MLIPKLVFRLEPSIQKLIGKARLDRMPLQLDDMIVGVLYGEKISANYKTINATYPVYVGAEFWERLTGDKLFYNRLFMSKPRRPLCVCEGYRPFSAHFWTVMFDVPIKAAKLFSEMNSMIIIRLFV